MLYEAVVTLLLEHAITVGTGVDNVVVNYSLMPGRKKI